MPETPKTPIKEPVETPAPKSPPPKTVPRPNPFAPDWPIDRPEPQPKA